jgi:hypothetical protein
MASKRLESAGDKPMHRYSLRSKAKAKEDASSHGVPPSPESTKAASNLAKDEPATPRPCFNKSDSSLADITSETVNTPGEKSAVATPKTPKSVRLKIPRKGIVLPEQATTEHPSLSSSNCWDEAELEMLGVTLDEYEFDLDEIHGDVNKLWPADVENCTSLTDSISYVQGYNVVSQCLSGSDEDIETSYKSGCPMTRTNAALGFQDALNDCLDYGDLLDDIARGVTSDGRLHPQWYWGDRPEASEPRRWLKAYRQSGWQPLQRKLFTIRDPFPAEAAHTFIKWIWDFAPPELKTLAWVADSERIIIFPWFKGFAEGSDWPKNSASFGLQSTFTRHEGGMRVFPGTTGHPADKYFFIIEVHSNLQVRLTGRAKSNLSLGSQKVPALRTLAKFSWTCWLKYVKRIASKTSKMVKKYTLPD